MLVTVAVLHRVGMCEHFVAVVEGKITPEERRAMADQWGAYTGQEIDELQDPESEHYDEDFDFEDADEMFFCELETFATVADVKTMPNADDTRDYEGAKDASPDH